MAIINKILLLMAVGVFVPISICFAEDTPKGIGAAGSKLGSMKTAVGLESDVSSFAQNFLSVAFGLLGTAFFILLVYGGFVWIKSAGRDEEVSRAKKIIATAVIGLIILLSSYAITNFVMSRAVGGGAGSGGGSSDPGCCYTHTDTLGNDWKTMAESVCKTQEGFMSWTPGPCSP